METPRPITREDQYTVNIINLLDSIDRKLDKLLKAKAPAKKAAKKTPAKKG